MVVLVIEGGAARATYASGVADRLQAAGVVPEAIYGTSAGGAIGAWYAAGQASIGCTTWPHIADRRLLSYRRLLLRTGPVIDFRLLYSEMYPRHFGMDLDALRRAPYPVRVTVTDADTADTLHPDLRVAGDPLALLHATSAMPIVSECPVEVDGRRFVDGGVTCPIPLRKAIDDGHRDILLIANRPPGPRRPEPPLAVRLVARQLPGIAQAMARRHEAYNEAIRLAERPPPGVRVRVVRPARDLGVSRFTRDVARLHHAMDAGRQDGARAAEALAAPA